MCQFPKPPLVAIVLAALIGAGACARNTPTNEPVAASGAGPHDHGYEYESDDFVAWDLDDDGYLSADEFDEGIYATWDLDDDGVIAENEFAGSDFRLWDVDGDGYIEDDEFDAIYATWDLDGDGVLDDDEFWP